MKWRRGEAAPDVIDQRAGGGRLPFPMPGGMPGGRAGGGMGLIGVIVVVAFLLLGGGGGGFDVPVGFGEDVRTPGAGPSEGIPAEQDPDRDLKDFSAYVFTHAQRSWEDAFRSQGRPYERAKLVLYRSAVSTGCGSASSAVGPFYCPGDQRVYLDLSFYGDMRERLGATGDFAWAYVIAHEVGHHVQRQLETEAAVRRAQRDSPDQANELSVRLELQADCYAGVWARTVYAAGDLEQGDVEEATAASEAVGDDRLAQRSGSAIRPDAFTHGTSAQRARWFNAGRASGQPADCDTFSSDEL